MNASQKSVTRFRFARPSKRAYKVIYVNGSRITFAREPTQTEFIRALLKAEAKEPPEPRPVTIRKFSWESK